MVEKEALMTESAQDPDPGFADKSGWSSIQTSMSYQSQRATLSKKISRLRLEMTIFRQAPSVESFSQRCRL